MKLYTFFEEIMAKNLEGKNCPKFQANATSEQLVSNETYKNKNLVIYFYPKDSTPGCTTEGQEFRDGYKKFKKLNTEILGVSRESIKSHENFKSKQNFPFELLSDPDEKVCKAFDVMKLKSMYGREYMGVDRSTFLINSKGKVVKEWRSVKVKGHVQEVLDATKELAG
jgi:peroxiredoxin Q/BCP